MTRRILLAPTSHDSGLSSTCLGLIHALDERGVDVGYLKPLAQNTHGHLDHTTDLVRLVTNLRPPDPISSEETEHAFARGHDDDLMERVLNHGEEELTGHDVVVIEGLVPTDEHTYSGRINILSTARRALRRPRPGRRDKRPIRRSMESAASAIVAPGVNT